jgi:hypothetical protein
VYSEPVPTIPYPFGFGSSSTLTFGQHSLFAALPDTAASHTPSLRHAISAASRLTVQVPFQRLSNGADTLSSERQGSSAGLDESDGAWHGSSQTRAQYSPSYADHRLSGNQQVDRVSRKTSRGSTGGSEPASPMPVDPQQFDFNTLKNGLAQHQVYGSPSGARKSRTNLQNAHNGRDTSRRDVSGKGSRELSTSDIIFTAPEISTGENDSGSAETSLHDGGRTGSRPDLLDAGGDALPRRTSRRGTSGANGDAIGNVSRQRSTSRHLEFIRKLFLRVPDPDLRTGTEARHQSRQNLGKTLNKDLGPPHGQKNHTGQLDRRADSTFRKGM